MKSAGGLPFLVEVVTGRDLGMVGWDVLLLVALAAVLAVALWRSWGALPGSRAALAATTFLLPAVLLTTMAMGKKTWPTYTEMVLFPLAMVVASASLEKRSRPRCGILLLFAAFSLLSVTAHSIWATLLRQAPAAEVHALLGSGTASAWLLLWGEVALFASYAALMWVCLKPRREDFSLVTGDRVDSQAASPLF